MAKAPMPVSESDMTDKALEAECIKESLHNSLCCICTDDFTDPRQIACGHAFCYKCLQMLERSNTVMCPICREHFVITQEEIATLPRKVTIQEIDNKLLNSEHATTLDEAMIQKEAPEASISGEVICDACSEREFADSIDIPKASWYCVDCRESQCGKCNRSHKRQKLSKGHQIIEIDEQLKKKLVEEQKANRVYETPIFCDICQENAESGNEDVPNATLHCVDCGENHCADCSGHHKRQRYSRNHKVVELDGHLKERLTKMRKSADICEVCAANNDNGTTDLAAATQYCINCQEKQCDQCSQEHKEQKLSKDHQIVRLDAEIIRRKYLTKEAIIISSNKENITITMCDQCSQESDRPATFYCIECEENQCSQCSEAHRRQKPCKDHKIIPTAERLNHPAIETTQTSDHDKSEKKPQNKLEDISNSEVEVPKLSRHSHILMSQMICQQLTPFLNDARYSKIQKIIEKPRLSEEELKNLWPRLIPHIIQGIKMWNGDVFTSQSLASLIVQPKGGGSTFPECGSKDSVSRLDCLTYIINTAEPIVAQDMLRILSKFPVAIPLIVQDINYEDKYIATIPLIQNVEIKWESTPGQIAENYLFTNPFRMIVAVRLGSNAIGKSTILNQLMRKQFVFSSCCEAGSRYGRPKTLEGSVEMVWLTQETCSDITWKSTMLEYYKGNMEEVAILANLHGDVFQHEDTLKYLQKLSCSFIVFLMPEFSSSEWARLNQFLSGKISVHILVDPGKNSEALCLSKIQTAMIASDDTQKTMRQLLQQSLGMEFNLKSSNLDFESHLTQSLKHVETYKDDNSEKILTMVRKNGCFNMRQLLGQVNTKDPSQWDQELKNLIILLMALVDCPREYAKQCLGDLETQLSLLSGKESASARLEVREAKERLRRIVKNPLKCEITGDAKEEKGDQKLKEAQEKLQLAIKRAELINIGQEHFFRALGQLYELSLNDESLVEVYTIRSLPGFIADLLIQGHAIELLNGDSGEIQILLMKAVCDDVSKKRPNLKVFVISIIGLQSSGKSTLLNALFSCRFAVSVGRCSRGLYMRMIMLEDDLCGTYVCDAIILIDTEGLCSPEKMNDPKGNQNDRLMTTYAMGVSDLTIVNILGEVMTEMTEILQIAIVAMARLRGGGIRPDLLMVQHLQERNISKVDVAKGQFCEALNKAFELITKNDIEIGSASAECLNELIERLQSGDLFQHFGPFRDGSSVNSPPSEMYHEDVVSLFETLFRRVEASRKKKTFERWSNHFESYWECVKEENFALNFKNVKHITDFLYFEKKIAKVKELLERAIRKHRDTFATQIREQISKFIGEREKMETETIKVQLLESIGERFSMIPLVCPDGCGICQEFNSLQEALLQEISGTEWEVSTKHSLELYNKDLHERSAKFLRQAFDGSAVKQGCFSDFSRVITEKLKNALDKKPDGIYTQTEQLLIRNEIWQLLLNNAKAKDNRPDPDHRFYNEVIKEYATMPHIVNNIGVEICCESLFKMNAVKSTYNLVLVKVPGFSYGPFKDELKTSLCNTIENVITNVFQSRGGDEYLQSGLDFEEGMVRQIKSNFLQDIKRVEDRLSIHLKDDFKIKLQIYTLQQFNKKLANLQEIWNKQNRPIEILLEKENDYMMEIETRLTSGFSCAGEGEIVAKQLSKAIRKKAINVAYATSVEAVLSLEWTTNSEKVRLVYFEQLAKEIQSGQKRSALSHFKNPKDTIEEWYTNRVDSFRSRAEVMKIFNSTLATESDCVYGKINNSTCKEDIDRILEHVSDAEDQYFSKLDPKDDDYEAFKGSVKNHLKLYLKDNDNIAFPLVSDDIAVKKRLGCTEHCYWCGALCWGSRDHQMEKEKIPEMGCHHSCHQPNGLKGVQIRNTSRLSTVSCHNITDTCRVWFKDFQEDEGMLWSVAKQNHFPDWKFDVHCVTKFDELMRWFFQELHQNIALQRGLQPLDQTELLKIKCVDLKLDNILNVVHSKI